MRDVRKHSKRGRYCHVDKGKARQLSVRVPFDKMDDQHLLRARIEERRLRRERARSILPRIEPTGAQQLQPTVEHEPQQVNVVMSSDESDVAMSSDEDDPHEAHHTRLPRQLLRGLHRVCCTSIL